MTSPFPTAFRVPVWAAVSETPELTGSGTVTDEERVDGLLRLDDDGLTLEGELVQSTTTLDGMGQRTEKESLGTHEFRILFDQLVSITADRRLFWPCLKIQASAVTAVQGLPGAKQGQVKVRVSLANWRAARTLVVPSSRSRGPISSSRTHVGSSGPTRHGCRPRRPGPRPCATAVCRIPRRSPAP